MVDAVEIPRALLREQSGRWSLRGQTISAGQSGVGAFPRMRMDGGGAWQAQYDSIALRLREHVLMWRQFEWAAEGGVQPMIVPMCDSRHAPYIVVGGRRVTRIGGIPHSDDSLFDDDTGYQQAVFAATIGANAALRATSLTIARDASSEATLEAGQYFSMEHETQGKRLYGIKSVLSQTASAASITICPPLREAVVTGEAMEFNNLGCVMALQSDDAMDLTLSMRRSGSPSMTFAEYFYPA